MSLAELREQIKQKIDALPAEQLPVAAELIEDLAEDQDATDELERIPGFAAAFEEGRKAMKEGRVTPIDRLRRKQ